MLFVLAHSPSAGPATWSAVAGRLADAGHAAVVPPLLAVGEGGPPFWPRVTAAVGDGLAGTDAAEPLVLVAHSNAGVFDWEDHRCAYLVFGPPYDAQARQARQRGWEVRSLPGAHLHQVVDPDGAARSLLGLANGSAQLS
jgi:hypothetical protein